MTQGTSIAALLKNKGFDFNQLTESKPQVQKPVQREIVQVSAKVIEYPEEPMPAFLSERPIKRPKHYNENLNRWYCPDWTTRLTFCAASSIDPEIKPNCAGCVLRRCE